MNGFEEQQLAEPVFPEKKSPLKTILIVVGVVVVVVAIVFAVVFVIRSRRVAVLTQQSTERIIQQTQQSIAGCENEADPELCKRNIVFEAAKNTGLMDICGQLEAEAYDSCVWNIAREEVDAEKCSAILNAEISEKCADGIYLKKAIESSDVSICENISNAEKQENCINYVDPITSSNCLSRGNEAGYCDNISIMEEAQNKQDTDICDQIADQEQLFTCRDLVGYSDRDFDNLDEEQETVLGTDDRNPDTDGDGLNDYDEVAVYGTDPLNPDTDGDGYLDGQEVSGGFNPKGEG